MYDETKCHSHKKRLCVFGFGLGFGVVKGLSLMLFAWSVAFWGHGLLLFRLVENLYPGMAPTFVGGLIGGLWGLVIGFICGAIVALVYNCVCKCCCAKKCTRDTESLDEPRL